MDSTAFVCPSVVRNPSWNYNYPNGHPAVYSAWIDTLSWDGERCIQCRRDMQDVPSFSCKDCFFQCHRCSHYFPLVLFDPQETLTSDLRYYSACHWCWEKMFPHDLKEPE